jgi:hypothetical protein
MVRELTVLFGVDLSSFLP